MGMHVPHMRELPGGKHILYPSLYLFRRDPERFEGKGDLISYSVHQKLFLRILKNTGHHRGQIMSCRSEDIQFIEKDMSAKSTGCITGHSPAYYSGQSRLALIRCSKEEQRFSCCYLNRQIVKQFPLIFSITMIVGIREREILNAQHGFTTHWEPGFSAPSQSPLRSYH